MERKEGVQNCPSHLHRLSTEAAEIKKELSEEKVIEIRRLARRRKVYAYKPPEPEINFPPLPIPKEDPLSNPLEIETV